MLGADRYDELVQDIQCGKLAVSNFVRIVGLDINENAVAVAAGDAHEVVLG